ncbi:MAG: GTPase HflX [Candidatus Eremiobacteraeota bacterium]|nr:GTPase HflX [Candidatus Eremiobacteraeota bacterium]MCW5872645.1 GTPase HflX [Candidatus Eremiobacteraeota bacterium]
MTYETEKPQPRAVLVGVPLDDEDDSLSELAQLAKTLGFVVVDQLVQRRRSLSGPYVLGEGKLEELKTRCGEEVEAVIFDCELTPSQVSNLQTACGVEVLDRTGVIVEIFSRHARTREARLQVEIARLKYLAPRLRKAGRGPTARADKGGETGLELDRRRIRDRIAELKKELEAIADEAAAGRSRRAEQRCVALVGYTNAGKSSLMRALTGSQVLVEDKLFATLDTTVRTLQPETVPKILVSDTVGFIRKLPHDLVASFRSTLEEARNAWLLLFVVDASDPDFRSQLQVTRDVLDELGAGDIESRLVLNKIDRLDSLVSLRQEFPDGWFVSAKDPASVAELRGRVVASFEAGMVEEEIFVPYAQGRALGRLRSLVHVLGERHSAEGTFVMVRTDESRLAGLRELARG